MATSGAVAWTSYTGKVNEIPVPKQRSEVRRATFSVLEPTAVASRKFEANGLTNRAFHGVFVGSQGGEPGAGVGPVPIVADHASSVQMSSAFGVSAGDEAPETGRRGHV